MLSALKNFGITFGICAVIFGLIAWLIVGAFLSSAEKIGESGDGLDSIIIGPNNDSDNDLPKPNKGNEELINSLKGSSFNMLVIVNDYRPDIFTYYPENEHIGEFVDQLKEKAIEKAKKEAEEAAKNPESSSGNVTITPEISVNGIRKIDTVSIMLIRVDKESTEYTFTPIPTTTNLFTKSGYILLRDFYSTFGEDALIEKISAITGIELDYTFTINSCDMPELIDGLSSFSVSLNEDIYTDGANYIQTPSRDILESQNEYLKRLENASEEEKAKIYDGRAIYERVAGAGQVKVDAENILPLMLFSNYDNGITDELNIQTEIAKGIISSMAELTDEDIKENFDRLLKVPRDNSNNTDRNTVGSGGNTSKEPGEDDKDKDHSDKISDFRELGPIVKTNMTSDNLNDELDLIAVYSKFEATVLDYPGEFAVSSGKAIFTPSIQKAIQLFYNYR